MNSRVAASLVRGYADVRHIRRESFEMVVHRAASARYPKSIMARVRMTDHDCRDLQAKRPKTTRLSTVWQAFWRLDYVGKRDDMRDLCWRLVQMRVGRALVPLVTRSSQRY